MGRHGCLPERALTAARAMLILCPMQKHVLCVLDPNNLGQVATENALTWSQLSQVFATPVATTRTEVSLVVGARFRNGHRAKADLLERTIVPLDFDKGESVATVIARLRELGLAAIVHTTARHTAAAPRLRAFIPLAEPITSAADWDTRVKPWMRATWPNVDTNAIDAARFSYAPVRTEGFYHELIVGASLVLSPVVHEVATKKESCNLNEKLVTELGAILLSVLPPLGSRHGFYLALTGFLAKQQVAKVDASAIITDLCEKSGAGDKVPARLNLVDETYRKHASAEPVAGHTTLSQALAAPESSAVASAITGLVGQMRASAIVERLVKKIAETKAPVPVPEGRAKKEIGASPEKLAKLSLNTAVQLLDTDPDWSGVWRYDEFSKKIKAFDSPFNLDAETEGIAKTDITTVMRWFEARGYKIASEPAERVIEAVARKNRYHPVRDFLVGCTGKDGAIEDVATRVLGLTDPLHVRMLRKTMIGACKRIQHPGCQVDTSLVLCGRQGGGKTSFCRILFGEWLLEDVRDIGSKELVRSMVGKWGVELAELDKILRAEPEAVKSFMTRTKDLLDRKYEHERDALRALIFLGTTNSDDFLRDSTGERRWWPVPVAKVNLGAFTADLVKEAWGEAYAAMLAGEAHWLTDDEECLLEAQREAYRYYDPLEEKLEDLMKGKGRLTLADVLAQICILAPALIKEGASKGDQRRVVDGLKRIGCYRKTDGKKRYWVYPGYVAEVIPIDRAVSK